ncbi:MAG: 3',5'-cyclic-nucleotide phosphodiesterase, partial [Gammaproteobacteria bacterium]|nr:3',5'-cyclic-nucleotide phosphodiesterase [Gammaproteobacteria bacterium]
YEELGALVVEVSFPNSQSELAQTAGHYCPQTLAKDLEKLRHEPQIWVTAMKPGMQEQIFEEVLQAIPGRKINRLKRGDVFEI